MMGLDLFVLAGTLSTGMFVAAALPMLVKAVRTREMASYSVGNLGMSNFGNALYSLYVFSTPPGPAWALHAFNTVVGILMLAGWLRYGRRSRSPRATERLARQY
ncbi:hypothetical protein [Lentzea sp. NPDC059081]|uniref:hypothetical protein n=1 Tax=Lentzea sp. NPDC059081 TaxID=3346719 RepID=UPI0036B366D8